MTGVSGQRPQPSPCPRGCGGYGDAHKLTCPTLRLPVMCPLENELRRVHLAPVDEAEDDWGGAFDMVPGHGG